MARKLWDYQTQAYEKWMMSGYRGIVKAVTSAGKTLMGINCLQRYKMDNPQARCLIVAPSAKVALQWEKECKAAKLDVPVTTYQKGINQHRRGNLNADCLLLDECHMASPEKQSSAILELNPIHILGLSATPGNSTKNIGPICHKVGWGDANVCPFTVHYMRYKASLPEMTEYDMWSKRMMTCANKHGRSYLPPGKDSRYDMLARNRRACCYEFRSRLTQVAELVKTYRDKRTVVFFERNDMIASMSKILTMEHIPHAICSQLSDNLADYEAHRCNILLLAKKLRTGWNDPSIEVVILASPTTQSLSHVQVVGRALRLDPDRPDKHAHIFALIAENTSDENLMRHNDFPRSNTDITTVKAVLHLGPGLTNTVERTEMALEDY